MLFCRWSSVEGELSFAYYSYSPSFVNDLHGVGGLLYLFNLSFTTTTFCSPFVLHIFFGYIFRTFFVTFLIQDIIMIFDDKSAFKIGVSDSF